MKTILITGANRGIGLEMTKQYLSAGWRVIACCRNPKKAKELLKLPQERLKLHQLDVAKPKEIEALAKKLTVDAIDILVNNAAVIGPTQEILENVDAKEWLKAFQINTIGPQLLSQKLAKRVAKSKLKIIVNISSIYGSIESTDSGNYFVYRSTKSALNQVTKCLSKSLSDQGIIVISIHPGSVQTDMNPTGSISPTESVQGIRNVLHSLTVKDSGEFFTHNNTRLPW